MPSIFSKIVQGEIPSYKIAEDDRFLAFLDIFPVQLGHSLIIPKLEVDYFYDMDDKLFADLHLFSKKVAHAIQKATECKRICSMVIGYEVPHAHLHLIPTNSMADMDFNLKKAATPEQLTAIAEKIRQYL